MADCRQEPETQASPSQDTHREAPKTPASGVRQAPPIDRGAALRKELEGVRSINESIEGVLATLGRAGGNMEVVSKTVTNSSTLLSTWTRILSQTEHNQRLILHPDWKGATEDLAEQEAEALERRRAAERKAAEEEERREELRRRRQEEDERRRLGTSTPSRRARAASRTRGTTSRGTTASRGGASSSYRSDSGGLAGTSSGRGISGAGRGFGAGRGRSRAAR